MNKPRWHITRSGRAWSENEVLAKCRLIPEKPDVVGGKLYWSQADRLRMLALLLENVGLDAAIQLADRKLWREALDALDASLGQDAS